MKVESNRRIREIEREIRELKKQIKEVEKRLGIQSSEPLQLRLDDLE